MLYHSPEIQCHPDGAFQYTGFNYCNNLIPKHLGDIFGGLSYFRGENILVIVSPNHRYYYSGD